MLKVANIATLDSYSMPVCTSLLPRSNFKPNILCWRISLTLLNLLVKMDDNIWPAAYFTDNVSNRKVHSI